MAKHPLREVAQTFTRLGCVCFGGPVAHIGHLRDAVVLRRRWLDEARFAELVALCQSLPGPSSSQLVFALGRHRAGPLGGILASVCFTLPSAAFMIAAAHGIARWPDAVRSGWLHGVHLAVIVILGQAVRAMGNALCPDRPRAAGCAVAAAAAFILPGALTQLAILAVAAAFGARWGRAHAEPVEPVERGPEAPQAWGPSRWTLGAYLACAVVLPLAARVTEVRWVREIDAFYRVGALVFGGGHVALPLLRAEVVARGWLDDRLLLAGYGAAQVVPGPLFTFAAYVGTAMHEGPWRAAAGLSCMCAMFLPGYLLIAGVLPVWEHLRVTPRARGAMAMVNAAVVGLVLAALCATVLATGVRGVRDVLAIVLGYLALDRLRAPTWALVGAFAVYGGRLS
jgi:chromate transporter